MKFFYILLTTIIMFITASNLYSSNNLIRLKINEVKPTILNVNFFSLRNYTDIKITITIQSNENEKSEVSIPKSSGVLVNCSSNYNYTILLNGNTKNLTCGETYTITEDITNEYEI